MTQQQRLQNVDNKKQKNSYNKDYEIPIKKKDNLRYTNRKLKYCRNNVVFSQECPIIQIQVFVNAMCVLYNCYIFKIEVEFIYTIMQHYGII